jgi:mediator of RNA polymerase II transcription subunit 6
MATTEEPLDEILWSAPHKVVEMQGIHTNSVLHYFAESVFFDRTSNNAIITSQAMYNPAMHQVVQTRENMETYLKTMAGLEFMVAQAPAETAPGTGTGVWVIRKQTRKKRPPEEDEITVHNTYYIVGEHIYMAPTVADVLGSRMVSQKLILPNTYLLKLPSFLFSPLWVTLYPQLLHSQISVLLLDIHTCPL